MFKQHAETVAHVISCCNKVVWTNYIKIDNNEASIAYRAICAEHNLEHSKERWLEQEKVVRNYFAKFFWDFPIHTDNHLLHNRLDTVLIKYKEQIGVITDIAVLRDKNIQDKKLEENLLISVIEN